MTRIQNILPYAYTNESHNIQIISKTQIFFLSKTCAVFLPIPTCLFIFHFYVIDRRKAFCMWFYFYPSCFFPVHEKKMPKYYQYIIITQFAIRFPLAELVFTSHRHKHTHALTSSPHHSQNHIHTHFITAFLFFLVCSLEKKKTILNEGKKIQTL